jgi:hypothetical protein
MIMDLPTQVRRIARFLSDDEINYDESNRVAIAVKQSQFAFMKAHESQFDERLSKLARNEACGLSKDAGLLSGHSKVRAGGTNCDQHAISSHLKSAIDMKWKIVVEPVTGSRTYEELRASLQIELGTNALSVP